MGKVFIASLRLAVGIVCIGLSIILGAHWLGLVPNESEMQVRARRLMCSTIADGVATKVRDQRWKDLKKTFQTHIRRDPSLVSIALRNDAGDLVVETGHHSGYWRSEREVANTVEPFHTRVAVDGKPWGRVELCFSKPSATLFSRIRTYPVVALMGFFASLGLLTYTIFVIQVLADTKSIHLLPERVRRALDTLAEGLLVVDARGCVVLGNRAFGEIVNRPGEDLSGLSVSEFEWVADDGPGTLFPWEEANAELQLQSEQILRYRDFRGSLRSLSVNAVPLGINRKAGEVLATFRDVTHIEDHRKELERMLGLLKSSRDEINRKNKELVILATKDALTGCMNRRSFFEALESLWNESSALKSPLACMMFDLDHFKTVNDTYGHGVGDEVLRHVSRMLLQIVGTEGLACRYGGEEFCVILPHYDLNAALKLAQRIRTEVAGFRLLKPPELRISVSIGVSELRFDASDVQELINQADVSLYVAKEDGRNRVTAFNISMIQEENVELQRIPRERIVIPYQAVTALVTALSYRDPMTAEHSRRVADLCVLAARDLLDPAEAYVTEVAALLHDVGKIGVPDEILLKQGKLSEEEWEVMGRRDRIGQDIITNAFDCERLSEITANQYAFFGGGGRDPSLPARHGIPIGARLLAIADTYDAIVSDKRFQSGQPHADAIAELRRCAGTQFDPDLVEHFAGVIEVRSQAVTAGAFSIQKRTAMALGTEIQCLADAVESRNVERLSDIASQLSRLAIEMNISDVANAAAKIESHATDPEIEWVKVLRDTFELMDLCRATQSDFLRSRLECEAELVNQ